MATPHVAGVAALVKAAHPVVHGRAAQAARSSAASTRSPRLSGKVATGGRLNACKASVALPAAASAAVSRRCVVPNVIGAKLGTATRDDQGAALPVGKVTYVKSTMKKKGKVIRESPRPGKHLGSNAKVNLWLGRGTSEDARRQ